jgi:hypothetical protein
MGDRTDNLSRAGRKPGSKNKRTEMLEAIGGEFTDGEIGFWKKVCEAVGGDNSTMAATAMKIIADRLTPTKKAVQIDGSLEHSRREFSDTERVERFASIVAGDSAARDRLLAVLGHLAGNDRPADGGSEE